MILGCSSFRPLLSSIALTCSFPWVLGTSVSLGREPNGLLEKIINGEIDISSSVESAGNYFRWHRYNFSREYGCEQKDVHNENGCGLLGVSDNFLVFDALGNDKNFVLNPL